MINTIIFDLGNVLVNYDPKVVYRKVFQVEEEMNHFLNNICTTDWHGEQDAGRNIKAGTAHLIEQYPEHRDNITMFYDRWEEMLSGPIEGTVEILKKLKATGKYKIYVLTNWPDELFPIATRRFEFLKEFDGIVVSGAERMRKPDPALYQLLLDRYNVKAEEALFIDDNLANVEAARKMGIKSILFISPEDLDNKLKEFL